MRNQQQETSLISSARLGGLGLAALLIIGTVGLTCGGIFAQSVDVQEERENPFLAELLRMKSKSGRDNSMIYYSRASEMILGDSMPYHTDQKILNNTVKDGWTDESTPLLFYFELYKPRFDLIRQGVAVDHAIMPDSRKYGIETPCPNFFSAQISGRLLCAQGLYYETQGKYSEALDNYLITIIMGAHHGGENAVLVGGLIANSIEKKANRTLLKLVKSGKLTPVQLTLATAVLKSVGKTNRETRSYLQTSRDAVIPSYSNLLIKAKTDPEIRSGLPILLDCTKEELKPVISNPDSYIETSKEYLTQVIEQFSIPYWQRDRQEVKRIADRLSKQNSLAIKTWRHFGETLDIKFLSRDAGLLITSTAVALEKYKDAKGRYPDSLDALMRTSIMTSQPIDPFSGKPLCYRRMGQGYRLYSVGPDGIDQKGRSEYSELDRFKGIFSEGDILH
jgi:hypothetical protein